MTETAIYPERQKIADSVGGRLLAGAVRAFRRRCPYCAGKGIFKSWFTLQKQCPRCGVIYAYETGYLLGAYAINLVITELVAVAIVIALIVFTELSVLQMQVAAVVLAVGLPISFYPTAVLIWIGLDIAFNPPDENTGTRNL